MSDPLPPGEGVTLREGYLCPHAEIKLVASSVRKQQVEKRCAKCGAFLGWQRKPYERY